ncbi:MAG: acyl-CoA dehydrogenase, partial [Calditrichaeota bacterium]
VKTFPADVGMQAVSNGLQVLGGSGFCDDYPLEQYYRDIRIMSIYEGTTGIQSLDLLGRKMQMKDGKAFKLFFGEIQQTIAAAMAISDLEKYAVQLSTAVEKLIRVSKHLSKIAAMGDIELSLADATLYQQTFSLIAVAWQWVKQGIAAYDALQNGSKAEDEMKFYQSKLHTLKYYFVYELPEIDRLLQTMTSGERLTVKEDVDLLV